MKPDGFRETAGWLGEVVWGNTLQEPGELEWALACDWHLLRPADGTFTASHLPPTSPAQDPSCSVLFSTHF